MPNVPDYSLYIGVKKVRATQTANTNTAIIKGRAPYMYDGYFPLYRSVGLPINALVSNKFTQGLGGGGSAGPPPFSPANIATLAMWLDGADTSTMTFSGLNITAWSDKSGGLHNVTASGSGIQLGPTPAGKQAVVMPGLVNFSIANVATLSETSVSIFAQASGPPVGVNDPRGLLFFHNNNRVIYGPYYYNGNSNVQLSPYEWNATNASISVIENESANLSSVFFNGNPPTNNTMSYWPAGSDTSGAIGGHSTGGTNLMWVGTIQEVLIYNRALLVGERQMVEGYLAWKWGTQGSLPANHPYKLAKP